MSLLYLPFSFICETQIVFSDISTASIGVGEYRVMQIIDSILSISNLKIGIAAIAVLLLVLLVMKIAREVRTNMQRVRINKRKNKEELKRI